MNIFFGIDSSSFVQNGKPIGFLRITDGIFHNKLKNSIKIIHRNESIKLGMLIIVKKKCFSFELSWKNPLNFPRFP